ncbi:MAG TPA: hypothetical protein VK929_15265 [Longimicrobiales bacterium]|nr:hypothetical protein [Longimicrobiales bacterium]
MATVVAAHQEHTVERCRAALRGAHAELGATLVGRMAGRIPPQRSIRLYVRSLGLPAAEAAWLCAAARRTHAWDRAHVDGHDTPLRFRDWKRLHQAPWGDAGLADELAGMLAQCTRSLGVVAARHALAASSRSGSAGPSLQRATAFLEQLDLPPALHAAAFEALLQRYARSRGPAREITSSRGPGPRFTRPGRPAARQGL